jgi:hypothetical protein
MSKASSNLRDSPIVVERRQQIGVPQQYLARQMVEMVDVLQRTGLVAISIPGGQIAPIFCSALGGLVWAVVGGVLGGIIYAAVKRE